MPASREEVPGALYKKKHPDTSAVKTEGPGVSGISADRERRGMEEMLDNE